MPSIRATIPPSSSQPAAGRDVYDSGQYAHARFGGNPGAPPSAFSPERSPVSCLSMERCRRASSRHRFQHSNSQDNRQEFIASRGSPRVGIPLRLESTCRRLHAKSRNSAFGSTQRRRLDSIAAVPGCVASGNGVTLDVKPLFDPWFIGDTVFGGVSTLHLPFFVDSTIRGSRDL